MIGATGRVESESDAPKSLFHPLEAGTRFGRWQVQTIGALEKGAVAVTVRDARGDTFTLEVLARETSSRALAAPGQTKHFAVHVRNGGDGGSATHEDHGLAAMTLAAVIGANEHDGAATGFLTLTERLHRHADELEA